MEAPAEAPRVLSARFCCARMFVQGVSTRTAEIIPESEKVGQGWVNRSSMLCMAVQFSCRTTAA
eukprot:11081197-Alexandrium_andersonii.AAC.1